MVPPSAQGGAVEPQQRPERRVSQRRRSLWLACRKRWLRTELYNRSLGCSAARLNFCLIFVSSPLERPWPTTPRRPFVQRARRWLRLIELVRVVFFISREAEFAIQTQQRPTAVQRPFNAASSAMK